MTPNFVNGIKVFMFADDTTIALSADTMKKLKQLGDTLANNLKHCVSQII